MLMIKKRINTIIKNKMSLGLLLSYLSILTAPVLAIIIIYFTSYNSLLNTEKEKQMLNLSHMIAGMEQKLDEIRNIEWVIASNNNLNAVAGQHNMSKTKANLYDMFLLSRSIPDFRMTNSMIKEVYIFFNNQDYLLNPPAVIPATKLGYQSVDFFTYSHEQLVQQFCTEYYHGNLMTIHSPDIPGYELALLQSFPYNSKGSISGAVLIFLNQTFLKENLAGMVENTNGISLFFNQNGEILQYAKDGSCPLELSAFEGGGVKELVFKQNTLTRTIDGVTYLVCTDQSSDGLWSCAVLIPKKKIVERIGSIKYLMIFLCFLSVSIGLFICFFYWIKRKSVLLHYLECQNKLDIKGMEETHGDFFWNGFHAFLNSVNHLQTTLVLQGSLLKGNMLRKLFFAEYHTKEEIERDMQYACLDLSAQKYCVAVIDFSRNLSENSKSDIKEFRLYKKALLEQTLRIPHYFYELNYWSAALLILCQEDDCGDELKRQMEKICEQAKQANIQIYVGISSFTSEVIKISELFNQASNICDYEKRFDIRILLAPEDLPEEEESFFFPMEMEVHFIKALRSNREQELIEIRDEIVQENMIKRKLSLTMLNHLTEIIRGIIVRIRKEVYSRELNNKDIIYNIRQAETIEEMFEILLRDKECSRQQIPSVMDEKLLKKKEKLLDLIEKNYMENSFNISVLSDMMEVSEGKLYKDFKQCFGLTFSEYLESVRINKACELLKQEIPVKVITEKTGYLSDISFRRAFKRVMGMPPTQYMEIQQERRNE